MERIINYFEQLTLIAKLILVVVVLVVSLLQFIALSFKIKYYTRILLILFITNATLLSKTGKIDPIWSVKFPIRNSSPLIMQNIKRGIAIFGSAGSGKTESGFVPILKHAVERNIPCLCYD